MGVHQNNWVCHMIREWTGTEIQLGRPEGMIEKLAQVHLGTPVATLLVA